MILYCKDSLGCIDNNNIELINNMSHCGYLYIYIYIYLLIAQDLLAGKYLFKLNNILVIRSSNVLQLGSL